MIEAFSEISVIDLSDVSKIQTYLTSNQPNIVVYDPNATTNDRYVPDWSKNNLVLTPVVHLDSDQVSLTDSTISIEWKRQAGSSAPTSLIAGEEVSNGVLTVSANVLATTNIITYICTVSYIDTDTKEAIVSTRAQMSYSLSKNSQEVKDLQIVGENAFLYDGDGSLASSSSITLTLNKTSNVTVDKWQYKDGTGTFVAYPNSNNGNSLTVNESDATFNGTNVLIVRCIATDSTVFDIHQINKIHAGAPGDKTYSAVLSNDSQLVPTLADGSIKDGTYDLLFTTITIYDGGEVDTVNWSIEMVDVSGMIGTYDSSTYTYSVTSVTSDIASATFKCTKDGNIINKRYTLSKIAAGADGKNALLIELNADTNVMRLNASGTAVAPTSVTFSATSREGVSVAPTNYAGRIKIEESTDGTNFTQKYITQSGKTESSKVYTPTINAQVPITAIRGTLYQADSTTVVLDTQTVVVVPEGKKGDPGSNGSDAYSATINNNADLISCNSGNLVLATKEIIIPFTCRKGITRTAGTAVVGSLPSGMTVTGNVAATSSADGKITLSVAEGSNLSNMNSGEITITITVGGVASEHKFSWSKQPAAKNSVNFTIQPLTGNEIHNGVGSLTFQTTLMDGQSTVTSNVTYVWQKYTGTGSDNGYETISGQTGSSLTITGELIESFTYIRCKATYGGVTYFVYQAAYDRTDPVQLQLYASIGQQLVNGEGEGALYALATRFTSGNAEEIDPIKTTTFSKTAPSNPRNGDYYYKIAKPSVTLMKYNGTSWITAPQSDQPKGIYKWFRRNSLGDSLDPPETPYATGKVIYYDKDVVDKKTIFTCKFTWNN